MKVNRIGQDTVKSSWLPAAQLKTTTRRGTDVRWPIKTEATPMSRFLVLLIIFVLSFAFEAIGSNSIWRADMLGRCVYCRYDNGAEGSGHSNLYLADLKSGSIKRLLTIERFKVTVFATDADWSAMVVGGFGRETDVIPRWVDEVVTGFEPKPETVSVAIYGGRLTGGELDASVFYRTNAITEPELSVVYSEDRKIFYIAYALTYEVDYVSIKGYDEIFSARALYLPRSFVTSYDPIEGVGYGVGQIDKFIYLEWGASADGKIGFSFYDDEGEELKGYGFFDPDAEEFFYPVDVNYSDEGGGIVYLFPISPPDEGSNIIGTYIGDGGKRKDIILRDKVIGGPVVSAKAGALVYLIRDRETARAKLKAKSIETGEEIVLDLPYDAEPALRSRYKLMFVE